MYEQALCLELEMRNLRVARQIKIPVLYKGVTLNKKYKLDLFVEDRVIVETKATEEQHPVYLAQCLTHCRLTGKKLGLVINFGQKYLKDGIHRVVNRLPE